MARLEFAILQHLDGKIRVVLRRDEKQLLERLKRRVGENIGKRDETIEKAIDDAFMGLVREFKDDSVKII